MSKKIVSKEINEECKICDYYLKNKCTGRYNVKVPCIYATKIIKKGEEDGKLL